MTTPPDLNQPKKKRSIHRWIRIAFLLWATFVMVYLANSYRTRGVPDNLLRSTSTLSVVDDPTHLAFIPNSATNKPALLFICGSGVSAQAYVPLLHPLAAEGHPVFIIKLPLRFAPLPSHKQAAVDRAREVMAAHPEIPTWVISGHSLGGALACRTAASAPQAFAALVLVGTTHPKHDMASLPLPVTKIYASNDRVAPVNRVMANKKFLPPGTQYIELKGGNHSQFGHYGHQLLDGKATLTRETQQAATREAIRKVLGKAGKA